MYQGTSAIINPDDYLSGKKLDRNFELYATEVEKDAPSKIDLVVCEFIKKTNYSSFIQLIRFIFFSQTSSKGCKDVRYRHYQKRRPISCDQVSFKCKF